MRRKKKARRGWRKLEEEEEEASPGFVDSWLRRCPKQSGFVIPTSICSTIIVTGPG